LVLSFQNHGFSFNKFRISLLNWLLKIHLTWAMFPPIIHHNIFHLLRFLSDASIFTYCSDLDLCWNRSWCIFFTIFARIMIWITKFFYMIFSCFVVGSLTFKRRLNWFLRRIDFTKNLVLRLMRLFQWSFGSIERPYLLWLYFTILQSFIFFSII